MKDLEKQIEEAAEKDLQKQKSYDKTYDRKLGFKAGVKSEIAKEYWQQEMYSENDVINLLHKLELDKNMNLASWFKQNKKK